MSAKWRLFCIGRSVLTHWGRVKHICVNKLNIIGSDNGLSPCRRQAIIWTNAGILFIRAVGTNFNEILSEIHTSSLKKMHLKMSSAKWRQLVSGGLNVLKGHWSVDYTGCIWAGNGDRLQSCQRDSLYRSVGKLQASPERTDAVTPAFATAVVCRRSTPGPVVFPGNTFDVSHVFIDERKHALRARIRPSSCAHWNKGVDENIIYNTYMIYSIWECTMKLWCGNVFLITGPLWGESVGNINTRIMTIGNR